MYLKKVPQKSAPKKVPKKIVPKKWMNMIESGDNLHENLFLRALPDKDVFWGWDYFGLQSGGFDWTSQQQDSNADIKSNMCQ